MRLLLICLALGAVPPLPARAAYAEIAPAPVAAAVVAAPATRRAPVTRPRPRYAIAGNVQAPALTCVSFVSRRYLVHQSLLL